MLSFLANRTFRHLFFAAQVIALLGTGPATVAPGLLAWQFAGDNAGLVLGTTLAVKMIADVNLAPVAAAPAERLPRRAFLVTLDLIRAGVVLFLPFVTGIWQIYLPIFLLQAASAGFTPAFRATIFNVLPDETHHTNALLLLRLAEDLELGDPGLRSQRVDGDQRAGHLRRQPFKTTLNNMCIARNA